jgi:KDO2-lipid IV(A) lauroyltransferase
MFGYKNLLVLFKAFFINIFTLFIPFIPRSVRSIIAGILGFCSFVVLRGRRKAILNVLRVVTPETKTLSLYSLGCKNLINYANNFADLLMLYHMSAEELVSITEREGIEHLEKALVEKNGVVLFSAHLGNWEVGASFISAMGFPVVGVAELGGPGEAFFKLFSRYRERFGTIMIALEDTSIGFKLRKYLRTGHIVGLIGDRDISKTGIEVTFFGKKAVFPQGPAFLSLVTKKPLIPAYFLRNKRGGNKIYYAFAEPPINFSPGKDNRKNIRDLTQLIAHSIERTIKRFPDQWFSFPPPWESQD